MQFNCLTMCQEKFLECGPKGWLRQTSHKIRTALFLPVPWRPKPVRWKSHSRNWLAQPFMLKPFHGPGPWPCDKSAGLEWTMPFWLHEQVWSQEPGRRAPGRLLQTASCQRGSLGSGGKDRASKAQAQKGGQPAPSPSARPAAPNLQRWFARKVQLQCPTDRQLSWTICLDSILVIEFI